MKNSGAGKLPPMAFYRENDELVCTPCINHKPIYMFEENDN